MPSGTEDVKESARKLFDYLGKNPATWVLSAERLKKAADGLRQSCWPLERGRHDVETATADFMVGPVYMMLIGFAVECVLKAMIVAQEPESVQEQKLSAVILQHDLQELWNRAGLRRCAEYDRYLKSLQAFIVSFGRYPVTRLKRDMDTMLDAHFFGGADFQGLGRLWGFLRRQLSRRCPDIPLAD